MYPDPNFRRWFIPAHSNLYLLGVLYYCCLSLGALAYEKPSFPIHNGKSKMLSCLFYLQKGNQQRYRGGQHALS